MKPSRVDFFGRPIRTDEERVQDILLMGDLVENWVMYPLLLLIRWPIWPLVHLDSGSHSSAKFSESGQLLFMLLCALALIAQILLVLYAVGEPIMRQEFSLAHGSAVACFAAAFAALTVVRIGVWIYENTPGT